MRKLVAAACVVWIGVASPATAQSTTPFADRAFADQTFGFKCMSQGNSESLCACIARTINGIMNDQAERNVTFMAVLGDVAGANRARSSLRDPAGFDRRVSLVTQARQSGTCH
jgi:hypothetical protein